MISYCARCLSAMQIIVTVQVRGWYRSKRLASFTLKPHVLVCTLNGDVNYMSFSVRFLCNYLYINLYILNIIGALDFWMRWPFMFIILKYLLVHTYEQNKKWKGNWNSIGGGVKFRDSSNSGGIKCWVPKLYAELCLSTTPKLEKKWLFLSPDYELNPEPLVNINELKIRKLFKAVV